MAKSFVGSGFPKYDPYKKRYTPHRKNECPDGEACNRSLMRLENDNKCMICGASGLQFNLTRMSGWHVLVCLPCRNSYQWLSKYDEDMLAKFLWFFDRCNGMQRPELEPWYAEYAKDDKVSS